MHWPFSCLSINQVPGTSEPQQAPDSKAGGDAANNQSADAEMHDVGVSAVVSDQTFP